MAKKSKDISSRSTSISRLSLFGPSPLLDDEDSAAFDALLAGVSGDVKPTDIIEEIWVRDIVDLTWEIFRWRRLKIGLLSSAMPNALRHTLAPLMSKQSAKAELATPFPSFVLRYEPKPPPPEFKLAQKWAARDPHALNQVSKLMAAANVTIDEVMARALVDEFDHVERIDRLAAIAEGRRNAILREIDRHRAIFAKTLREKVHDVEEAEFKIIQSKAVNANNKLKKNTA